MITPVTLCCCQTLSIGSYLDIYQSKKFKLNHELKWIVFKFQFAQQIIYLSFNYVSCDKTQVGELNDWLIHWNVWGFDIEF